MPSPAEQDVNGAHSPPAQAQTSFVTDSFAKAVLLIVKQKLDSDYKLGTILRHLLFLVVRYTMYHSSKKFVCFTGRITREEYRAIAKKATNKVKMKTKVRASAKVGKTTSGKLCQYTICC